MAEPDYTAMAGGEMLSALGDDGDKWATAFIQVITKNKVTIDQDLMRAWFANAIEHSTAVRRHPWADAIAACDSEAEYQVKRWGEAARSHEIAAWLTYMTSYLREAVDVASRNSPETPALDVIRKVTTMGLACLHEHGAPHR